MEAQAQSVLAAEEDQQEVIYLVVDENPQGQQVTQIVSDGQLIGQHAQIIMQDGKQAVLITEGNQQQVVLLEDEVGPEQVQSALEHGAVQQNVLQQPSVSVMMSQSPATASTSTANGSQVQYLVTEGGEIISPITQVNQPVVTIASQQQQQPQHQLVVTQSGLVRIGGTNKKDGTIVPGKSLINQAALKEAAARSPRGKLEDQVLVVGVPADSAKTQSNDEATLREVINDAVDKQISGIVPNEQAQVEPTTDIAVPTESMELPLADANAEINSSGVPVDAKDNKDETDTIGFNEGTNPEAVEPDSTQSGCTETVNGHLEKDMINSVTAVGDSGMVSVSSDIPPLSVLPDQMMQDDEENRSADEVKNMQVPQVFNVPDQTMEIDASEIFSEKEQSETKLASDDSATEGLDATSQSAGVQPTSTLIIHDPEGKKQPHQEAMASTVITVISPQPKKKKRRYDMMRQEELESPPANSAKLVKPSSDSIASRRERRTSKPTRYYELEVDYEVYTADIYRSYRRGSKSGDEASTNKAKKEQRKNIEDNFGFDIPSTDDEQLPPEKKRVLAKQRKSDMTESLLLPSEKPDKSDLIVADHPLTVTEQQLAIGIGTDIKVGADDVVTPQPVKRGRGRPPKHPRKSLTKAKPMPKKVLSSEQTDTSATEEIAADDKASTSAEMLPVENQDAEKAVANNVTGDGMQLEVENGLDSFDIALKKGQDDIRVTSEQGVADEKVMMTGESQVDLQQPPMVTDEMQATEAMLTLESGDAEKEMTVGSQDVQPSAMESVKDHTDSEQPVEELKAFDTAEKMASESEVSDGKVEECRFVKPAKKGTPGRPRGRPRKSSVPTGQTLKRSPQSDNESPRRSGRAKEKPCYAESSGEESQEAMDVKKDEIVTPEQLREESNKVYSLQKEVTDLKFINDSLELRLAQQSGCPEEIRSLQARVDSLQMRNNELEAKLKNYEKSQKIGINIKGMKFSIKKDNVSPTKSKPSDDIRLREIELTEQGLKARETLLEKRELKAKALDHELDERGAQLTKRESKLDRWERKLKSQEKEIEYKEKRLKRLENDLRDLGGTGGRHKHFDYVEDTELIVQQKDLQLWKEELRQREAEMLEKEKLLAATEKQLMALNTELNEKAEYLQAKEQGHSSGDEDGLLTFGLDDKDHMSFKPWHSEGSSGKGKKTKGKRQNCSSSSLLTSSWITSAVTSSDEGETSSQMLSRSMTPKGSAKSTPKTAGTVKGSSTGKRKSFVDSQKSTPASVKQQKATLKSSGKKKSLKSPVLKTPKETPKSRKSKGQVQKKKLISQIKSSKINKTKRK